MNKGLFASMGLLAVNAGIAEAAIEKTFQRVALSAQPAPGLTNVAKFSSFDSVSLADDGWLAFTANLSGPGISSTNRLGLWAGPPGSLQMVVRTGDPVPGNTNGDWFTYFWAPNADNRQAVGFLATTDECENCEGLKFGLALIGASRPSDGKIGIASYRLPQPSIPAFQDSKLGRLLGHVIDVVGARVELFGGEVNSTNNFGIVAGPPTNAVLVARTGSPAPGVAGPFTFFPATSQALALAPDGHIAFMATVSDGPATREGIWYGKGGTVQAVMVGGKGAAPESLLGPGYTFGFGPTGGNLEVNARGELAFSTYLSGPGLNSTNSDFVVAGQPATLRVVAQMGQPAPGIPGAFFRSFSGGSSAFSEVFLGADGAVAFVGCYSASGNDFGLWLAPTPGATPVLLMRNGQQAPGAPPGAVFTNSFQFLPPFEEAYMNARNQIVFRANVGGPGIALHRGIWLADPDGTLNLILREGDSVDLGGGVTKQVTSVSFGTDPETLASPEDGRRSPFNDRSEIALVVYFSDFSSGLILAQTGIRLSAEKVGAEIRLRFPTLVGRHYRVEFSPSLASASWSELLSPVTGTGGEVTVTDPGPATQPRRYYRVVRLD